jgi:hypothetical protein
VIGQALAARLEAAARAGAEERVAGHPLALLDRLEQERRLAAHLEVGGERRVEVGEHLAEHDGRSTAACGAVMGRPSVGTRSSVVGRTRSAGLGGGAAPRAAAGTGASDAIAAASPAHTVAGVRTGRGGGRRCAHAGRYHAGGSGGDPPRRPGRTRNIPIAWKPAST